MGLKESLFDLVMNTTASIVVQHLLFSFLLVVAPIWDYVDTRRLKQHPDSARKIRYYRTLCVWLWAATVVACLAVGFRPLFTINPAPDEASWLFEHSWVRWLVIAVISIFTALTLLPVCIGHLEEGQENTAQVVLGRCAEIVEFFLAGDLG